MDGGSSLAGANFTLRAGSNFLKGSRPELFSEGSGFAAPAFGSCADAVAVSPANYVTNFQFVIHLCFFLLRAATAAILLRRRDGLVDSLVDCGSLCRLRSTGLGRVLLLQFFTRDIIRGQVKAGFDGLVRALLVHLLDFEVRDRDDALVVRHLIEELSQT